MALDGNEAGLNSLTSTVPTKISYWRLQFDHSGITPEVLNYEYEGSGTEDDPYAVSWIPDDPRDPMQFSMTRKVVVTFVVGFATLIFSFTSSAYVGTMRRVIAYFDVSTEVATLGLSLFVLGFAVGPLLWAPLSETIGRQIPFFFTFLILAFFSAGCAGAQSISALLVLRFFAGAVGSAPLTNAGGIIADMFAPEHRGLALCVFSAAPYLGPSLGPTIGGFLGMAAGWRWVLGFLSLCAFFIWILVALTVPETYAPVLLRKRANRLSQMTGKCYASQLDLEEGRTKLLPRLKIALSRPWILLVREPIVLLLTLYASFIYGTLYMLFGAFPIVYQDGRGWNPGVGGLPFLGVAVGTLSGSVYVFFDNRRYIRVQKQYNGNPPPECRLPPCMISAITIPIGLIWFAWTNSPSMPWIVSIIALVPFGFGMMLVYNGMVSYLLDAYTIYSASVLSSLAVVRYMFGVIFPLFTTPMYEALGIHWASMVPAFLSVACVPIPFAFYRYGASIRSRCKYAAEAKMHAEKVQRIGSLANRRATSVDVEKEEQDTGAAEGRRSASLDGSNSLKEKDKE